MPPTPGEEALVDLLRRFVEGPDRSLRFVNEIEKHLLDHFHEDERLAGLLIATACYRPEGGPWLYDEAAMIAFVRNELAGILKERGFGDSEASRPE